jgi:hypothetical protein
MAAKGLTLIPGKYFSMSDDIIDVHAKVIGANGVAVYAYLCRWWNRKTGKCTPSIKKIAATLDLSRTTVKETLHTLRDVGLIGITARRDPAGDPTSNQYDLLDTSAAATENRRRALQAAAAGTGGRSSDDPPLSEQGRSSDDLPSVVTRPTGRSSDDPEPGLLLEPKRENQGLLADAEKKNEESTLVRRPERQACLHPVEERIAPRGFRICLHCYQPVDEAATPEEDQAHAASAA